MSVKVLSVIIVSFNTREVLRECLNSINFANVPGEPYEVIVVDNNSQDGTKEMLFKDFPSVKTVFNKSNVGFGTANNQGMRIAKGKYFLLLNSDTISSSFAMEKCIEYMNDNIGIGVMGCRLENVKGKLQLSCGRNLTLWHSIFGGIEVNKVLKKIGLVNINAFEHLLTIEDHNSIRDVDFVVGAFMLLRREVFDQTEGFDEKIFLYGEELEWCYRIRKAGWRIVYYPEATIVHIGQASGVTLNSVSRNIRIISGREYFFKKHHGKFMALLHSNVIFLSSLFKLIIWFIIYLFSGMNKYYKNKVFFQVSIISWFCGKKE